MAFLVKLRLVKLCSFKLLLVELIFLNFFGSNFFGSNFFGSNFFGSDFCGSNFFGSNFVGVNLFGSNNFYINFWVRWFVRITNVRNKIFGNRYIVWMEIAAVQIVRIKKMWYCSNSHSYYLQHNNPQERPFWVKEVRLGVV